MVVRVGPLRVLVGCVVWTLVASLDWIPTRGVFAWGAIMNPEPNLMPKINAFLKELSDIQ